MASTNPSVQFFAGVSEEIADVSLRREPRTGKRVVVMIFKQLKALEGFQSFTKQSLNSMVLADEEGEIRVTPTSTKFIFGGPEGDDLQQLTLSALEVRRFLS
ncbi:photosystem II reaction center protein Psb28 [Calothrix sp. NIES-3974]|uniref:photosystem II reaction center protein Psb28 n=1 Tax=Calothrix sp. NIES-3974 TaxID=2005462 RepID=UPI000BBC1EDC|nr:photosystem II reaction center protein Psb28 [Calothrix sp. NIES-3974]